MTKRTLPDLLGPKSASATCPDVCTILAGGASAGRQEQCGCLSLSRRDSAWPSERVVAGRWSASDSRARGPAGGPQVQAAQDGPGRGPQDPRGAPHRGAGEAGHRASPSLLLGARGRARDGVCETRAGRCAAAASGAARQRGRRRRETAQSSRPPSKDPRTGGPVSAYAARTSAPTPTSDPAPLTPRPSKGSDRLAASEDEIGGDRGEERDRKRERETQRQTETETERGRERE